MLDLSKVIPQVEGMIATLKAGREEKRKQLEHALEVFSGLEPGLDDLSRKISASNTTWLVARLVDGLNQRYEAPPVPAEFTVIASDGSHIDVDRHKSTRCYLINLGGVVLHYGAHPDATLDNTPCLYARDEDLTIAPFGVKGREQLVEGPLLGIKRSVEECRELARLAARQPPGGSTLALVDGSLILWNLEAYPEFVTEALLDRCFIRYLADMKKLNSDRALAPAGYISFPRSTDVANVLRVALCPEAVVDTDRYCPICTTRECEAVAGVQDRDLFFNSLNPGERSPLFISPSKIQKHYGEHTVYFFYLKAGDEIARVEVPRWVATDKSLLNLAHALVIDQCRRGQGYPVALSEAHERAVITGADREHFWQMVESSLLGERMSLVSSAKSLSKRTRWV